MLETDPTNLISENIFSKYKLVTCIANRQLSYRWIEPRHEKTCLCHMQTTKARISFAFRGYIYFVCHKSVIHLLYNNIQPLNFQEYLPVARNKKQRHSFPGNKGTHAFRQESRKIIQNLKKREFWFRRTRSLTQYCGNRRDRYPLNQVMVTYYMFFRDGRSWYHAAFPYGLFCKGFHLLYR